MHKMMGAKAEKETDTMSTAGWRLIQFCKRVQCDYSKTEIDPEIRIRSGCGGFGIFLRFVNMPSIMMWRLLT